MPLVPSTCNELYEQFDIDKVSNLFNLCKASNLLRNVYHVGDETISELGDTYIALRLIDHDIQGAIGVLGQNLDYVTDCVDASSDTTV